MMDADPREAKRAIAAMNAGEKELFARGFADELAQKECRELGVAVGVCDGQWANGTGPSADMLWRTMKFLKKEDVGALLDVAEARRFQEAMERMVDRQSRRWAFQDRLLIPTYRRSKTSAEWKGAVRRVIDRVLSHLPPLMSEQRSGPCLTNIVMTAPQRSVLRAVNFCLGGLSLVGGLAASPTLPAIAAPASWSQESGARFMEISSLLIPHRLNEEVGKRIGAAMSALDPVAVGAGGRAPRHCKKQERADRRGLFPRRAGGSAQGDRARDHFGLVSRRRNRRPRCRGVRLRVCADVSADAGTS